MTRTANDLGVVYLWYAPELRQIVKVQGSGRVAFDGLEVASVSRAAVASSPPARAPSVSTPPPAVTPSPSAPIAPPAVTPRASTPVTDSGAAGGRTFISQRTRSGQVDDLFLERLTRSKGRAIVTASRSNEVSIELNDLGHGVFTYYLVQGLKGAADLNRDGLVTLQELYEYVEQEVSRKARSVGGNQHPVMKGELEGALPLVKVRRP